MYRPQRYIVELRNLPHRIALHWCRESHPVDVISAHWMLSYELSAEVCTIKIQA